MENLGRRDSTEDEKVEGINDLDHFSGEAFQDSSSKDGSGSSSSFSEQIRATRIELGLTERLTEILVDEGDGDLLIQQNFREDRLLEWLQALEMQITGACRSDERLKPLLKMNVSNGVAEDRLLAQLSQHFEPAEVGILARCFCIPLVSVRVGKIDQQGTRMCPTSNRGNLNLAILPTSDLRFSFAGDDGHLEMLFTLSRKSQCSAVTIDEIKADSSGRSFLLRIPDGRTFYFWCSEKSKLLGIELLTKMKDVLKRKPSIAELSGISKSRLDCFATQLHAFLMGNSIASSASTFQPCAKDAQNADDISRNSLSTSKFVRSRHVSSQATKASTPHLGSLSPRPSSFKEGQSRNLASFRNAAREKGRWHGDGLQSAVENLSDDSTNLNDASGNGFNLEKQPVLTTNSCISDSFLLQFPGKLGMSPLGSVAQVSSTPPIFSPYYCWCPPGASPVTFSATSPPSWPLHAESSSLPPLSSLLPSSSGTNLLIPCPSLSLADVTSVTFPSFLPDPLVRLSLPVTQQIPTFIPLMCDPIVHIPVIDVCSSGQGYLVSAGPAMSTSIPPLHSKLVNPLIPETDSLLEKSARETLRLLINGSTQANQQILDVLPNVLTSADVKQSVVVTGSRGLYSGTGDVRLTTNSIPAMRFLSFPSTFKVDGDAEGFTRSQISNGRARKSSSRFDDALSDDEPHGGGTLDPKNENSPM